MKPFTDFTHSFHPNPKLAKPVKDTKQLKQRKCKRCDIDVPDKMKTNYCSTRCYKTAWQNKENRKKGAVVRYSPEWLERIKTSTKEAMNRPDIKEKISKPRKPMNILGKTIRSNALAGKMPSNMMFGASAFPNVQRGTYLCSKGDVYFRSKWEANYALYLDFLVKQGEIEKWEFEPDKFIFDKIQFGTRSYVPDFKVWDKKGKIIYHEIKGYMDSRSKTKLKRMAKYYPKVKLILIDGDAYKDIKKKIGKLCKFY